VDILHCPSLSLSVLYFTVLYYPSLSLIFFSFTVIHSLLAQNQDIDDSKDGLLSNKVCTVKFPLVDTPNYIALYFLIKNISYQFGYSKMLSFYLCKEAILPLLGNTSICSHPTSNNTVNRAVAPQPLAVLVKLVS
jgi:hypothetical protein